MIACRNMPPDAAFTRTDGTATSLTDAARVATRLYDEHSYDSAVCYGQAVLRKLPERLTGNRDSLKEALMSLCLAVLRSGQRQPASGGADRFL